ncbi:MAG: hypothetical protein V1736_07290, partial [Pseudomonadota bacterium]
SLIAIFILKGSPWGRKGMRRGAGGGGRRRERRYAGRGHNAVMSSGVREVAGRVPAFSLGAGSMTATALDKWPLI